MAEIELQLLGLRISLIYTCMPAICCHGTTQHRDRRSNDPAYDKHVEEVLDLLNAGEYKSFRSAAKATGVRHHQSFPDFKLIPVLKIRFLPLLLQTEARAIMNHTKTCQQDTNFSLQRKRVR